MSQIARQFPDEPERWNPRKDSKPRVKETTPLVMTGEYAPMQMVERAVRNARPREFGKHPRWVAVMDVLAYGSTTSQQLCLLFKLDPHEEIDGPQCEECERNADIEAGRTPPP